MKGQAGDVRAVLFDMDGTITRPYIDFAAIRCAIGVPEGTAILEHIAALDGAAQLRAREILAQYEIDAARKSELNPGAREVLAFLHRRGIPTALITRNNPDSVRIVCQKHGIAFDVVVTAEDAPPKPSPEPVRVAARKLGVEPASMLMVGDYLYDIQSGAAAGSKTVLVTNGRKPAFEPEADFVIEDLTELIELVGEES
jgi:HAD superfamily hydrolase (TIGR01509 family)